MRGFIACVAAVLFSVLALAGSAGASPVRPPRCDHRYFSLGNGEGVSVFCDFGPMERFRVIAHCEAGLGSWNDYGTIGYSGFEASEAQCRGLVGAPHVAGFHIDWL